MSAETRQAVADAIRAHAADEWSEGALIVDWTVITGMVDGDGDYSTGSIHSRDPMPRHVARGLLHEGLRHLDMPDED